MRRLLLTIGPPGTGKTTALMGDLAEVLRRLPAYAVAAATFTRAACWEIWRRIEEQLGLDLSPRAGGKVGTVHSLCYNGLGRPPVFGHRDWVRFCHELQVPVTEQAIQDDAPLWEPWEPPGSLEGDLVLAFYNYARNCQLDLAEAYRRFDPGYGLALPPLPRLTWLVARYEEAKQRQGKVDYCDMLLRALERKLRLGARALFLDEAQDLSPLQLSLVRHWMDEADEVYVYADPDQTIYAFQGAEPSWLLSLGGDERFLARSHRVPERIASAAQDLIARNRTRYHSRWQPASGEAGSLRMGGDAEMAVAEAASGSGTWAFLARNRYLLSRFTGSLQEMAIPYVNLRGASPWTHMHEGVRVALRFSCGEPVTLYGLQQLLELVPARGHVQSKAEIGRLAKAYPDRLVMPRQLPELGFEGDFAADLVRSPETALSRLVKLPGNLRRYYLRVLRRYGPEALAARPWVTVSTIHGVKGREFDHVVLLPDWAYRTQEGYWEAPEPERRVWYVGMTRARKTLWLLEPGQRHFCEEVESVCARYRNGREA